MVRYSIKDRHLTDADLLQATETRREIYVQSKTDEAVRTEKTVRQEQSSGREVDKKKRQ